MKRAAFLIVIIALTLISWKLLSDKEKMVFQSSKQGSLVSEQSRMDENISTSIKIMAVGDIMMHKPQIDAGLSEQGFNYESFFQHVQPIFKNADLVLGNLETTFAGEERGFSGYPTFNAPDELANALKKVGFTVITTANNHSMDKGEEALYRTLEQLDRVNLPHTGTFRSEEEREKILILERNNISTAILAYTNVNNIRIPRDKAYLINQIDFPQMKQDIKLAREQGADLVVVAVHFGIEYQREPNVEQLVIVDALFNYGADIILGSHSHVLQPYEFRQWTTTTGEERKGVVIYSLGNFISNQRTYPRSIGGILSVTVEKLQNTVDIQQVEFIPSYVHRFKTAQNKMAFRVLPMEDIVKLHTESTLNEEDYLKLSEQYLETVNHVVNTIDHPKSDWFLGDVYVIRSGDTFFRLAHNFGITIEQLEEVNPGIKSTNLQIGQIIRLPDNAEFPAERAKKRVEAATRGKLIIWTKEELAIH